MHAFEKRVGHKFQSVGGDKTRLIAEDAHFAKLYARFKGLSANRSCL